MKPLCSYRVLGSLAAVLLAMLVLGGKVCGAAGDAKTGGAAFDAAPFATAVDEEPGKSYGLRWGEPRKVRQIEVEFEPGAALPDPKDVRVQYWHASWNGHADPIQSELGAGGSGWGHVDDWTNGGWQDADTRVEVDGKRWSYTFAPSAEKEYGDVKGAGVRYRRTLKVRLVSEKPLPKPREFRAFTDAVCRPLTVRIVWDQPKAEKLRFDGENAGQLEVYNGSVLAVRPCGKRGAAVDASGHFTLPAGVLGGIEADLLMAVDPIDRRYDRTIVTVRTKHNPFSFAADEAARGDRIGVDDLGALAVRGDDSISVAGWRETLKEFPGKTIYDRVSDEPEQWLSRAWNDMPLKRPLSFTHGLPGNRNAMRHDANGDIAITSSKRWFEMPHSAKDTERKAWLGDDNALHNLRFLTLGFGFPSGKNQGGDDLFAAFKPYRKAGLGFASEDRPAKRELLEGYLPLLRSTWTDDGVFYEQCAILDKLEPNLDDIRIDDPTVMLVRIRVANTSSSAAQLAKLCLTSRIVHNYAGGKDSSEKLVVDGDRVFAEAKAGRQFRYLIRGADRGTLQQQGDDVQWSLKLAPGESHELQIAIPAINLDKPEEFDALRKRDFDADSRRICDYWRQMTSRSARIETPEPWLNDFYKSVLRHQEVNCLRDGSAPRRYARVGTFIYGVYPNESTMMVSDLDRRGCHKTAQECLQTWLDFQGTVMLPGNFKSKEGLFFGADGREEGGYNKHHGYAMWCMAEHWWYTRDRAWMEQAAPKLIKACDWVTKERQATLVANADGSRPIEYGFLPAGGLEDVQDYWFWLATNVNTVWGFDSLAKALADYGHPEAARLQKDAKAYHEDVMRGLTEARVRTPVVRLRDATYVPKYPSHLHERGRASGWIRETLEGSIFLLTDGLIPRDAPEAVWILKDYEDNLYISEGYGYSIPVFDEFWFSRGGFSMQANLLDGPIPYLYCDKIKHFERAYFNGFASAFYPDIRMCNEHSLPELGYPAGDHFKSSDESNVTYWLRLMFVREVGDDLYLGQAIPRYWMVQTKPVGIERAATHFGPMSLWITSKIDQGEIHASVTPPERNRPKTIYLRLRHPASLPIKSVTLNGKPYDKFDAKEEWVVLPGDVEGPQEVVARY